MLGKPAWATGQHAARCASASAASLSFIGVVLAVLVRGFDSNAAAPQRLSKKNLDFGVDTP